MLIFEPSMVRHMLSPECGDDHAAYAVYSDWLRETGHDENAELFAEASNPSNLFCTTFMYECGEHVDLADVLDMDRKWLCENCARRARLIDYFKRILQQEIP